MSVHLTSLRKKKVVDTSTAATLGRVKGVLVDATASRLSGLLVAGGDTDGVIAFADILSLGDDAVTVRDASVLTPGDPASGLTLLSDAVKSRLLDEGGYERGRLKDLLADDDGRIVGVVSGERIHDVPLKGHGSYATVIAVRKT